MPLIWIAIYTYFYASARLAWNTDWSWWMMAACLIVLALGQS